MKTLAISIGVRNVHDPLFWSVKFRNATRNDNPFRFSYQQFRGKLLPRKESTTEGSD